jgi:hypothetical protein
LPLPGHPPGVGRESSSLGEAKLAIRRKGLKLPSLHRRTAEPEVRAGHEWLSQFVTQEDWSERRRKIQSHLLEVARPHGVSGRFEWRWQFALNLTGTVDTVRP